MLHVSRKETLNIKKTSQGTEFPGEGRASRSVRKLPYKL